MSKILIGFGLFFGSALVLVAQWLSGDLPQAHSCRGGRLCSVAGSVFGFRFNCRIKSQFFYAERANREN